MRIGSYVKTPEQSRTGAVFSDDSALRPHLERPWFRAYLARRLGTPLGAGAGEPQGVVTISEDDLARHTVLTGSTGSGKSRALELFLDQEIAANHSVVLIDPKGETADRLLARVQASGRAAETVTLLDPRSLLGIPGWNPLATDIPLSQAVADFVHVLEQAHASWGPRLADTLTNALLVVGAHGLSCYELARFLVREDYRNALLGRAVRSAEPLAYAEAVQYFQMEFNAWGRSERAQATSPVLNKVRELLRSPFLFPCLCARRNTLDLASYWRRPGVLIIRLDRAVLGEEGARLLGGLLIHLLFRTALRTPGSVPVALAIDELPLLERFVGKALAEIVTVARSLRLRLYFALQHWSQLSEPLREALLANAAVQAFFRLGYDDARLIAASLAANTPAHVSRLTVAVDRVDRYTGEPEYAEWRHPIRDPYGRPLRMGAGVWKEKKPHSLADLHALTAAQRVGRLYVRTPDTGQPVELGAYLAGLSPADYRIEGPSVQAVVWFPRPRIIKTEQFREADALRLWVGRLQALPVQHAVVRLAAGTTGVVKFSTVDTPTLAAGARDRFLESSRQTNGQTPEEIASLLAGRQEQVEQAAAGRVSPSSERPNPGETRGKPQLVSSQLTQRAVAEVDDGSLW